MRNITISPVSVTPLALHFHSFNREQMLYNVLFNQTTISMDHTTTQINSLYLVFYT